MSVLGDMNKKTLIEIVEDSIDHLKEGQDIEHLIECHDDRCTKTCDDLYALLLRMGSMGKR